MKTLLLVIITTWSFSQPIRRPNTFHVIETREQAAQLVSQNESAYQGIEPDQFEYRLYEIDLGAGKTKRIIIPAIKIIYDTTNADTTDKFHLSK